MRDFYKIKINSCAGWQCVHRMNANTTSQYIASNQFGKTTFLLLKINEILFRIDMFILNEEFLCIFLVFVWFVNINPVWLEYMAPWKHSACLGKDKTKAATGWSQRAASTTWWWYCHHRSRDYLSQVSMTSERVDFRTAHTVLAFHSLTGRVCKRAVVDGT